MFPSPGYMPPGAGGSGYGPALPFPPMPVAVYDAPAARPIHGGGGNRNKILVYLGNLPSAVEDAWLRRILEEMGTVVKWTRTADPLTNRRAKFGFCEFQEARGAYLAVEILNGFKLGHEPLLVKCQQKVLDIIDEWKKRYFAIAKARQPNATNEEIALEFASDREAIRQSVITQMQEKRDIIREILSPPLADRQEEVGGHEVTPRAPPPPKMPQSGAPLPKYMSKDYLVSRQQQDRLRRIAERQASIQRNFERMLEAFTAEQASLESMIARGGRISPEERQSYIEADSCPRWRNKTEAVRALAERTQSYKAEFARDAIDRDQEMQELEAKRRLEEAEAERQRIEAEKLRDIEARNRIQREKQFMAIEDEQSRAMINKTKIAIRKQPVVSLPAPAAKAPLQTPGVFGQIEDDTKGGYPGRRRADAAEEPEDPSEAISDEALYSVAIDWPRVTTAVVSDGVIVPWIKAQIKHYMGEGDVIQDVVDFVMEALNSRTKPLDLLAQVETFLDDDAPAFVNQLWRLLMREQSRR